MPIRTRIRDIPYPIALMLVACSIVDNCTLSFSLDFWFYLPLCSDIRGVKRRRGAAESPMIGQSPTSLVPIASDSEHPRLCFQSSDNSVVN